jgi:hypothetical protein
MGEFLEFLIKDPKLGIIALFGLILYGMIQLCSTLVLFVLKKNFKKDVHSVGNKMAQWQIAMAGSMSEIRGDLSKHSLEMIGVQKRMMNLKEDLIKRADTLKLQLELVERSMEELSKSVHGTQLSFDEKFGRVLTLKDELQRAYGKIILLEERSDHYAKTHSQMMSWFEKASKALHRHEEEIKYIKKGHG